MTAPATNTCRNACRALGGVTYPEIREWAKSRPAKVM